MWVNMHVSESYLDEKYADQKKRWVNVNVVQSSVGECSSGWNPRLPYIVLSEPVLPNVRPLGALRPFEPIFKGFTPPLRPYAP